MITLSQAQTRMCDFQSCSLEAETLAIGDARGRVISEDVVSTMPIPPSDNSAMDGFAVSAKDVASLGPALPVSQRVPAGASPNPLVPGTAARIFTGGVMPLGADAVVIQENCEFDDDTVRINGRLVQPGDNVRPKGQDIMQGAQVVRKGQRLTAVDLSLLASIGATHVSVFDALRVAVFSTGDELVEPGTPLQPGQIYNSNRRLLISLCEQLGFRPVDMGIVEDSLEATKTALAEAASKADVILSSGGVSVGDEDHVKPAVESLGSLDLWKVKMKPGKPVAFGQIDGTPFLGLPGNPVSSFVIFQLLAVPLLRKLQGQLPLIRHHYAVQSGFKKAVTTREEYIRARLLLNESGDLVAERFANLSSGVLSSLSWADGLVRQSIDEGIKEGQVVDFFPLSEGML